MARNQQDPGEREWQIMREASRFGQRRIVDVDPEDPSQQLDDTGDFYIEPLDVSALPAEEAAEDVDAAAAENMLGESEPDDDEEPREKDTGELYGIRTPHAADTDLSASEDRDAYEGSWRGENWLESLEEHATEMGPTPEEEVIIVDDEPDQPGPRARSAKRRRPVADQGSGGRGGM